MFNSNGLRICYNIFICILINNRSFCMIINQLNSSETFEVNDGEVNVVCEETIELDYLQESKKITSISSTNNQTDPFAISSTDHMTFESFVQQTQEDWIAADNFDEENEVFDGVVQNLYEKQPHGDYLFHISQDQQYQSCQIEELENLTITPMTYEIQTNCEQKTKSEESEKNDSKNVPKGMMKAFAHMILDKDPQNVKILQEYFQNSGESFEKYKERMKKVRKSSKISITEIRDMLLKDEFASTMRKLGCYFLRKRFLTHIFNSKMEKRHIHLKYIQKWLQIFRNPIEFISLK